MSIDTTFLGSGWSFPPSFDLGRRKAVMVSEEEDIEQSLIILLSTNPGERVMQPSYGCGLKRMVFEHMNQSAITEIKDLIEKAVLFFEVRITLNAVQVETGEMFEGVLRLRLDYTVRTTNARANLVFPLYITEGSSELQIAA
jgi:phage baseplate assembly protein W